MPFRLGLWVGGRVTPNTFGQARDWVRDKRSNRGGGGHGSPHQLTGCPWCGSTIEPGKHIEAESNERRTRIFCPDLECPFGEYLSDGEGLPVLVVDEEIYRLVPPLIIATVDKFAQLTLRTQQPLPGPGTVGGHHLPGSARRAGVLPMTPDPAGTDRARERWSCGMAMIAGRIDPAIARCWARVLGRGGPRKHCWKLRPPRASITMPCPWPGSCVNVPT